MHNDTRHVFRRIEQEARAARLRTRETPRPSVWDLLGRMLRCGR